MFQHRYLDLVLAQWFRCFVELLVYVAICTLIFKLLVKCVCVVLASMRKPFANPEWETTLGKDAYNLCGLFGQMTAMQIDSLSEVSRIAITS